MTGGKNLFLLKYNVMHGSTKSCGCVQYQNRKGNIKLTESGIPNYVMLITQCVDGVSDPKTAHYADYGGRGISGVLRGK